MFLVLFVIILSLTMSYLIVVAILRKGWLQAMGNKPDSVSQFHFISIIIPVRNEAASIVRLMEQLCRLQYPSFEIIVVDDGSTDQTMNHVRFFSGIDKRIRLLPNQGVGKKKAITTGVTEARGEIIVTTDGDCQVQQHWLTLINQYFQKPGIMMVFGGVAIQGRTFFAHVQAIEFSSLIGSGAAMWSLGNPVMCNGANLAFRRSVFLDVNGYAGNEHIASGDDEFLMRKIHQRHPSGVSFLNHSEAVVQTQAAPNLTSFFRQRIRWAGKWRHNVSTAAVALAIYVFSVQLSLIGLMLIFIFAHDPEVQFMAGVSLAARFPAELFFLFPVCRFLNVRWHWPAYFLLQFIYPFYVVGTGLFSNLISVNWKDRRINL
jgi:poly-beta-1,6-N-acetyl-D-glucosamine synthase